MITINNSREFNNKHSISYLIKVMGACDLFFNDETNTCISIIENCMPSSIDEDGFIINIKRYPIRKIKDGYVKYFSIASRNHPLNYMTGIIGVDFDIDSMFFNTKNNIINRN